MAGELLHVAQAAAALNDLARCLGDEGPPAGVRARARDAELFSVEATEPHLHRCRAIVAPVPAPPSECGHPGEMACVTKDDALVANLAPRQLRRAPLSVEVRRAEHVAVVALLPPLALLGLWFAFARILRGFRGGHSRART